VRGQELKKAGVPKKLSNSLRLKGCHEVGEAKSGRSLSHVITGRILATARELNGTKHGLVRVSAFEGGAVPGLSPRVVHFLAGRIFLIVPGNFLCAAAV